MKMLRGLTATWPGRALVAAAVAVIVGTPLLISRAGSAPAAVTPRTTQVTRGAVTQSVAVSGSLNALGTYRLSFKTAGKLAELYVTVGQAVQAGAPLARLDTIDLEVARKQAQASLASAEARYDQTVAGAAPEDLAIARLSLDNAQRSLDQARRTADLDLATAMQTLAKTASGYTSAKSTLTLLAGQVAVDTGLIASNVGTAKTQQAQVMAALDGAAPSNDVISARSTVAGTAGSLGAAVTNATTLLLPVLADYRAAVTALEAMLGGFDRAVAASGDLVGFGASYQSAQLACANAASRLSSAIDTVSSPLGSVQGSLISALTALQSPTSRTDNGLQSVRDQITGLYTAVGVIQQSIIATKSRITQAGTSLSTVGDAVENGYAAAIQGVASTQERTVSSVASAQASLESQRLSFAKTTAPAKAADVASAYASVLGAQVSLDTATSNLASATLRAPTAGVVSAIGAQLGENVTTGGTTAAVTVANTTTLALHGTVGEAEVANLKLGQVATLNVDAVGVGTRLTGKVMVIDPVATIQQGVPVYGIDITIDVPNPQVRAGMSATANVIIASKADVLTVPNTAIRSQSGRRSVQVLRGGEAVDATVTFGIANDTVTEVLTGLEEGEVVVLPTLRATIGTQPQPFPGAGGAQQIRVPPVR